MPADLSFFRLPGLPMIKPGDDLCSLLLQAVERAAEPLADGDVLFVAQKIISKAEGRQRALADVDPGPQARELGAELDKDPRLVQLILDESTEVVRKRIGVLIVRHHLGFVQAHAGIDQSNIEHHGGEQALLLPVAPDASAAALRDALTAATGKRLAVVITDSMNRPWRIGTIGQAIGSAGFAVTEDLRGGFDTYGRELLVSMVSRVDSAAACAALLMGETDEQTPAVVCRGLDEGTSTSVVQDIIRPLEEDLFR